MNEKELLNIIADLKKTIEDQGLITRRTIMKNYRSRNKCKQKNTWIHAWLNQIHMFL